MNISYFQEPLNFDPIGPHTDAEKNIISLIYEPLFEFLPNQKKPSPLLALDQPTLSKDGLKATIRLRTDVDFVKNKEKFKRLTSNDVIHSFKRHAHPEFGSELLPTLSSMISGYKEYVARLKGASQKDREVIAKTPVRGLQALDEYSLQITLLKRTPELSSLLTSVALAVIPEGHHFPSSFQEQNNPPGTGPFTLDSYIYGKKLTLKKNSFYANYPITDQMILDGRFNDKMGKSLPLVDQIDFWMDKDDSESAASFLAGQREWILLSPHVMPQFMDSSGMPLKKTIDKGYQIHQEQQSTTAYLILNKNLATLKKFLETKLDRNQIIKDTGYDFLIPVGSQTTPPLKTNYQFKQNIVRVIFPSDDEKTRRVAQVLQKSLGASGLKSKMELLSLNEFRIRMQEDAFDIAFLEHTEDLSPNHLTSLVIPLYQYHRRSVSQIWIKNMNWTSKLPSFLKFTWIDPTLKKRFQQ